MKWLSLDNSLIEERYHVNRRIRCGSFTELFLGTDRATHREVVIKVLNTALKGALDPDVEGRLIDYFQTEARVLDQLRHQYIIQRLSHGAAEDLNGRVFYYLVLEYMPGGDLMGVCKGRPLLLGQALRYCHQVCQGLGYAHRNGIIHRDIKPQNLLLDASLKRIKITDFGIAKVVRGVDLEFTRGIGTETYAPPECFDFQEDRSALTPSADIYSLAKTLYVMVTGVSPREYFQRPITRLTAEARCQSWAPGLREIIERATQHEPRDRYATVDDFWRQLASLTHGSQPADASELDEETVVAVNVGPSGGLQTAPRAPEASAVRVTVPINAPPKRLQEAIPSVAPLASETPAEEAAGGWRRFERRRWARRLFLAGLAVIFMVCAFWVHGVVSDRGFSSIVSLSFNSAQLGIVEPRNLNLRRAPDQSSPSYGWIPHDTQVEILGRSRNGWYKVETYYWDWQAGAIRRGRGWVAARHIKLLEEESP